MNTATLVGNLTDDIDLRHSADATGVANMTVAVSRRVCRNGECSNQLDGYFETTAFG